eukprot:2167070-Pyramimonas_sp.AAC.1
MEVTFGRGGRSRDRSSGLAPARLPDRHWGVGGSHVRHVPAGGPCQRSHREGQTVRCPPGRAGVEARPPQELRQLLHRRRRSGGAGGPAHRAARLHRDHPRLGRGTQQMARCDGEQSCAPRQDAGGRFDESPHHHRPTALGGQRGSRPPRARGPTPLVGPHGRGSRPHGGRRQGRLAPGRGL